MPGQLIGPNGQPIGAQPVVAHIIEVNRDDVTAQDLQAVATYWQQRLGVPAIILTGGVTVRASVLADGELVELPVEEELTVKVKALLDNRVKQRADAAKPKDPGDE